MLFDMEVDVILLRYVTVKDAEGAVVIEKGRPKTEIYVMFYDAGDGWLLPGSAIPEIPPEECEGCDPFDDNAPCEAVAMSLVEHVSGLTPRYIEDGTYHQFTWKNCTDYSTKPIQGKAVLYYYGFVQEETESETEAVEAVLSEKGTSVRFFSEKEIRNPNFEWAGGDKDEEAVLEILHLFKPHIEH